jgi:hypothetical protein
MALLAAAQQVVATSEHSAAAITTVLGHSQRKVRKEHEGLISETFA